MRFEDSPLPRELDPAVVTPGLLGLVLLIAMAVALYFLMRSFVRQLRRIDIPGEDADDGDASDDVPAPPVDGGDQISN